MLIAGDFSAALDYLQMACGEMPRSARAWYLTGYAQRELGMSTQSRTSFGEAVKCAPGNARYKAALEAKPPSLFSQFKALLRRIQNR